MGTALASIDHVAPSLYSLLELTPLATTAEVRAAYLRLAKLHHPDRVPEEAEKAEAARKFQALARAYVILSDGKTYSFVLQEAHTG
ncbi:hypothetical protein JCM8115_003943 [Rhodotorula mucilaginosa]